jgi:uncharacterized protein YjiS (DUF1127 family)
MVENSEGNPMFLQNLFHFFSPAAAERRARYRQVFFELEQMTARELDELGIRRCDIPRIARESAVI